MTDQQAREEKLGGEAYLLCILINKEMARTSLKAIEIPEGVTLENNQRILSFTGKLGNMTLEIHGDVDINQEENSISFSPNKDTKESLLLREPYELWLQII